MSSQPPFETFEHTADVGLTARGRTPEEVFVHAAQGLVDLMVDPRGLQETRSVEVTVSAPDREALLVSWLNELLYLLDTQRFIPLRCRITNLNETSITAQLVGDTLDPSRHAVRRMVKAATYHGLRFTRTNDHWEARLVLDL